MTLDEMSTWLVKAAEDIRPGSAVMLHAAQEQQARILIRTRTGVDVDGAAFAPYRSSGKKSGTPTLFESGQMLDSMHSESVGDEESRIGFADGEQAKIASFINDGTAHMPARHFFGVSTSDEDQIRREVTESIMKSLQGNRK